MGSNFTGGICKYAKQNRKLQIVEQTSVKDINIVVLWRLSWSLPPKKLTAGDFSALRKLKT